VLRDRWLRAEAELQNYRRRARRDADEARRIAEERVMLEIVHALDDLDRAVDSAAQSGAPESWAAGVKLTAQRLREYLGREGVRTLDPVGQPFDPAFHEAILEVDAPAGVQPGQVVQVVLKGYARGDRSLRPARVVVARAPHGARGA
jgi:molecular chaperone GrpE